MQKPCLGGSVDRVGVAATKEVKETGCDMRLHGQKQMSFALVNRISANTMQLEI